MERLNMLHHVEGCPMPQPTSSQSVSVYPPGKKHFVTDPRERLARYEGDGGVSKAVTIPMKFRQRVKALGSKEVLAQKRGARDGPWTKWTWQQYQDAVMQVAQSLVALGCAQHEAISILGFNSPEWFFAAAGGIFAGLTPTGIYITNGPDAVQYIVTHSKARVMFVDSDLQLKKVLAVKGNCPSLKCIVHWGADCPKEGEVEGVISWESFIKLGSKISLADVEKRIEAMHPDNACYLSYTSGTTGNPKAVMYSHDNIVWSFTNLSAHLSEMGNLGHDEREVSYLPLSHIAGNFQLLGAFTNPDHVSSCVYFAFPDAMQGSLPDTLKEVRPTHFLGVPRVWEKFGAALQHLLKVKPELIKMPKAVQAAVGLDQVKVAATGAAPTARPLMKFFDSIGICLYEIYGMTENTAYSHLNQPGRRRIGSVGPALEDEGAGVKLANETNEICTWSRGVMMGYMYMPEKTAETFDDEGFLRTGDVGSKGEDGLYTITGRIKEMIITGGGENCAPVLLEDAIKSRLPAISNVVMIGDKQKYLIALITLRLEPNATGGFTNQLALPALAVDPACKTAEDVLKSEAWKKYINEGIESANKIAVSRAQRTSKWTLLPSDFSPVGENCELTSTLKLKRNVVQAKYIHAIKECYGADFVDFVDEQEESQSTNEANGNEAKRQRLA